MAVAGVEEITVNFVGADEEIMAQADRREPFQFVFSEYPAHGVVRVTEDKDLCSGRNGLLEGVEIDLVGVPVGTSGASLSTRPRATGSVMKWEKTGGWTSTPSPGSA